MQDAKELLPLVTYLPVRIVVGCVVVGIVLVWTVWVIWSTRHRKIRTISNLGPKNMAPKDITTLKKKYLGLIDEVERQVVTKQLAARTAHQKLSLTVRLFAFEASGFRAQVMTLADIEKGQFPMLSDVIKTYYPNEFASVMHGTVGDALQQARQVVSSWQ
ncbi:hypothetical protein H7Y29_02305 [Microbacteriaceae bacterium]|nr:hypothetical protein [Candidatus Saccharibacteria bacterium]